MAETIRLYKEKVKAVGYINGALNKEAQVPSPDISFKRTAPAISRVNSSDIILTKVIVKIPGSSSTTKNKGSAGYEKSKKKSLISAPSKKKSIFLIILSVCFCRQGF